MTIIRAAFSGVELTSELRARLADRVIGAFAEVECGQDNPLIRGGFLMMFESMGADDVWNGSSPMAKLNPSGKAVVIQTQVMAGPWTAEMKADLYERVQTILREEIEMPRPKGGGDIWMTFVEVPEGGWGVGGRAVSVGKLAPAFTTDRRERIERYLAGLKPD